MEQVRKAFDEFAQEYDTQREYVIPELRQFYGMAVWAAESLHHPPVVLDIGAGTGLMSAFLLQKFPDAHITLMDFSENMLNVARQRFAGKKNIQYTVNDYSRSEIGGPYDIVCSALSIHHLTSNDKQHLFDRIFSALSPGGMFVNADQADGETAYFRDRYTGYWNDFLMSGPMNYQELEGILKRRNMLDRNDKLSHQLQWLRDSGFSDVDVIYKNRTFIVTLAKKTGDSDLIVQRKIHEPMKIISDD
jgi:tRNA (cmo5U34)-methyltransferase